MGRRRCQPSLRNNAGLPTGVMRDYISIMADKGTHNPSQKSIQRWETEGGAPKGKRAKRPREEPKSRKTRTSPKPKMAR